MLKRALIGGCIILCVGGVWFAWATYRASEKESGDETAEALPLVRDVTLPDAQGKLLTLSEIRAPVRIVHFWASWSPYSKNDLPVLVDMKRAFGADVEVLAINRDTNPLQGHAYLDSLALGDELHFVYDREDGYYREVGGYNMPETVFVGSGGEIHAHTRGPIPYEEMVSTVRAILNATRE